MLLSCHPAQSAHQVSAQRWRMLLEPSRLARTLQTKVRAGRRDHFTEPAAWRQAQKRSRRQLSNWDANYQATSQAVARKAASDLLQLREGHIERLLATLFE
jgi:hypothetical protein